MRVIIEETAIADIDALAAWIAKDSPQSGRLVVEKILHTIARLELFPKRGMRGETKERTSAACPVRRTSSCTRCVKNRARFWWSWLFTVRVIAGSTLHFRRKLRRVGPADSYGR
jgi:plasmid stabilization system protein ParE